MQQDPFTEIGGRIGPAEAGEAGEKAVILAEGLAAIGAAAEMQAYGGVRIAPPLPQFIPEFLDITTTHGWSLHLQRPARNGGRECGVRFEQPDVRAT